MKFLIPTTIYKLNFVTQNSIYKLNFTDQTRYYQYNLDLVIEWLLKEMKCE